MLSMHMPACAVSIGIFDTTQMFGVGNRCEEPVGAWGLVPILPRAVCLAVYRLVGGPGGTF